MMAKESTPGSGYLDAEPGSARSDVELVEDDELARVLHEVTQAMSALCSALTLHPDDGSPASLIYSEDRSETGRLLVTGLLQQVEGWSKGPSAPAPRWTAIEVDGVRHQALSMPVQRVDGHSQLVISTFFDEPSSKKVDEAERVFSTRRPFAVGYFRLWQRDRVLGHRLDALESALNLTDFGVILLDRSGDLAFVNEAGETILAAGDGLRRQGKRLSGTDLNDSVRLRVAIDHVVSSNGLELHKAAPILKLTRKNGPPLIASVLPNQRRATEAGHVAAILYVLDPALDLTRLLGPVCKLYQLSNAETALVCHLVAGLTLSEASDQMRIKEPTARTYLKNAFGKTGSNRQADLIRLMLSNVIRTSRSISHLVF